MDTSIQVAAMVVIASFTIERVSAGVFFLLSLSERWNRLFMQEIGQKRQKLIYYAFVAVLATIIVLQLDLRVFQSLQLGAYTMSAWQDRLFTILVLMGGSDQIAALLKSPHAGKATETTTTSKPIEVTGKLTLDEGAVRALRTPQATRE